MFNYIMSKSLNKRKFLIFKYQWDHQIYWGSIFSKRGKRNHCWQRDEIIYLN